jgi:hypothetical protein
MAGGPANDGWRGKRGKAGPAKPNWRKATPTSTAAGGSSRTVKLLALGGCAVAVVVVVVICLKLLAEPQRAGLIAVAGDPGSAARLDVRYDPAGWVSAARLLEAVKNSGGGAAIGPVPGADAPFDLNDETWLDAVAQNPKVDPVVVYVGLTGGVTKDGDPVLYPGRGDGPPVKLVDVVAKLKVRAGAKRTVLVLDVGRNLPDPNLGEVAADFARAAVANKALAEEIAKSPTLAVILATGDEARAWDSADRGMTVLAHALRAGLTGQAGREGYEAYRLRELSEYVVATVQRASENERPTVQKPVLLPAAADEWADGSARARQFAERPFYRPPAAKAFEDAAVSLDAPPRLTGFWEDAQKLATARPAPWVYTPAAWRRYRELILRYEQGVLAGDGDGQEVLIAAIKAEKDRIEEGTGVKLNASIRHALPLDAALGRSSSSAGVAATLKNATSLESLAKKLKETADIKDRPPTEAHLPLMLHHFVTQVVPPPFAPKLDASWRPAVTSRQMAEQAALSGTGAADAFPYSERIWPVVRAKVLAGDLARRRGEDRMLTDAKDDKTKSAEQEFTDAQAAYRDALKATAALQPALAARDEAFSDLPFLSRWANEVETLSTPGADPAALAGDVVKAWTTTHALAEAIDKALQAGDSASIAALADATLKSKSSTQTARQFAAAEAGVSTRNPTQTKWLALQHLATLPVPLVGPVERAANFRAAREMASEFYKKDAQAGDKPQPGAAKESPGGGKPPAAVEEDKAGRRSRTTYASLGSPHADAAGERTAKAFKDTSELSSVALGHRQREAKFADSTKPEEAEALSRLAAPVRATESYEPAAANARRRWTVLLEALARRAALDHWFDETNQPYLTKFAQDYLADANALKDPAKPAEPSADATEAGQLIAAAKSDWKYSLVKSSDLTGGWTTEKDNRFAYQFDLGGYDKLKALLPAEAVVWASVGGNATLTLDEPATRPRPVSWQADPGKRGAEVEAQCPTPLESRKGTATLTATAYFRGHVERTPQDIAFDGRPHVVQTDLQPPARGAIALRAEVDPGAVAVLIDYSGSMTQKWDKGNGKTKQEVVVNLLRDLLPNLPAGTRLSIRLMRQAEGTATESGLIFDSKGPLGVNGLTAGERESILSRLDVPPDGLTPLVRTMKLAAEEDFPKNFDGVKTLIVVTDGADTSHISDTDIPQPVPKDGKRATVEEVFRHADNGVKNSDRLARKVNADVEREFRGLKSSVQMVVFGADEFEQTLALRMFGPLEDFDDENRGRVIVAADEGTLRREILESLRPRVKLLDSGTKKAVSTGKPPNDVPRIGIPASAKSGGVAGDSALWRGTLDKPAYFLKYLTKRAEIGLAGGDALVVRLRRSEGESKYEFERECYYRDVVGKNPKIAGDRAVSNGSHFLHVPNFGVGNPGSELSYLAAVASLDRVDSLKPGDGGDALSVGNPRAHWWEVRRTLAGAKEATRYDKPLSVWNAFGLVAPSWRLVTDGVRNADELKKGTPFQLAVWPAERPLSPLGRISFSNSDLKTGATSSVAGVRVRAKLEEIAFLGSKYPENPAQRPFPRDITGKPQRCLVLRIDNDPAGRLLRAKVDWEVDTSIVARQHLYYFRDSGATVEKAEVKAYTVILGPLSEDFINTKKDTVVELLDLGEAVRQVPTRRIDLDLGRPADDRAALHALPFSLDP